MSALARTHRTFSVSDLITVQSVIRDQVRRGARKQERIRTNTSASRLRSCE